MLQAESSLYSELDKLSAAWEALDRQVQSKIFELTSMEERVTKFGVDVSRLLFDCSPARGLTSSTAGQVGEQVLRGDAGQGGRRSGA